jgi:predicted TIM-barrel fold metal-dependent hydrolase
MFADRIISADSHIVEPADFWTRHIDTKFIDRAPHAHVTEDGVVHFVVDKTVPLGSVGAPSQAGVRFDSPEKVTFEGRWEEVRPGCNQPIPRLRDLEIDGVSSEVIFPTLGARLYGVVGGELLTACFHAGNLWLEEFCQSNPRVFNGLALLNTDDVTGAVAELERSKRGGLVGGMIPTYPGEARPYDDPVYDPLWAAAQDLNAPLAFHISATRPGPGQLSIFTSEWQKPGAAAYSSTQDYWVRRSVANMIFAGVFERFPNLKVAIVEHELSWAIYFLQKMDST